VVGEFLKGEKTPKIIGVGEAPSLGMRHGYVVNIEEASNSVKQAVALAEKTSGIKIKRAFVSLSGTTLKSEISTGVSIITKADGEVTNLDTTKALEECEDNLNLNNKKVVQVVPLSYKLDGKDVEGRLEGMRGNKLEVRALFVTYSKQHLEDLLAVLAEAGVETIDVLPAPLASSYVVLSDKQKIVGGALVDIGAEKVSIAIFENNLLTGMHTFSIGGADITNDIALGMKIPLETAESLKLGNLIEEYSQKKLDEIVEARLSDIFELIENYLKKIKRSELLPAGIVFVGGGSNIPSLTELSKEELKLPSSIGNTEIFGNTKTKLRDPAWFTALGLIMAIPNEEGYSNGSLPQFWKDVKKGLKSSLKQLMP
jgi:cell division protein FtsA